MIWTNPTSIIQNPIINSDTNSKHLDLKSLISESDILSDHIRHVLQSLNEKNDQLTHKFTEIEKKISLIRSKILELATLSDDSRNELYESTCLQQFLIRIISHLIEKPRNVYFLYHESVFNFFDENSLNSSCLIKLRDILFQLSQKRFKNISDYDLEVLQMANSKYYDSVHLLLYSEHSKYRIERDNKQNELTSFLKDRENCLASMKEYTSSSMSLQVILDRLLSLRKSVSSTGISISIKDKEKDISKESIDVSIDDLFKLSNDIISRFEATIST